VSVFVTLRSLSTTQKRLGTRYTAVYIAALLTAFVLLTVHTVLDLDVTIMRFRTEEWPETWKTWESGGLQLLAQHYFSPTD
jgi:hypothetical protein